MGKFLITIITFILLGSSASSGQDAFILRSEGLQTLPTKYMSFSENLNENAKIYDLQSASWNSELATSQSYVDGYWVRFIIKNETNETAIGINHNWNQEKKIFVSTNLGIKEYPYWRHGVNAAFDDGRILGQYKIQIPIGTSAVIYDFFRSKPFDRYYGAVGGLDRMTIGLWKDVRIREFFRIASNITFISIGLAFGLYYLFVFMVSGGNYIWLSLTIFQATATVSLTQSPAMLVGIDRWWAISEISFCFYCLFFIFMLQFLRQSLEMRRYFAKIDRVFSVVIYFYAIMFVINYYSGMQWPGEQQFDLIKYPPDHQGPGLVKLKYLTVPFCICLLVSVILSVITWSRGSKAAKFMFYSFMQPLLAIPITLITFAFYGYTWVTMLVGSTSAGILFLSMFITFGLATAQQINELKRLALLQQIKLTEAYQRFVPKQLLKNLRKDSILDVNLGDQVNMEMSIMFSDIRSFTSISEKMSPKENFGFVNTYLNEMGPIVRAHGGYIDKFMGDGIMALFPDSPSEVVRAAVKMQQELERLNLDSVIYIRNPVRVGIGINTGMMMLGTIGEADRMEGSVISDAVNLASRLEGLTKLYKSQILISEDTYSKLKTGMFYTRLVDFVAVKGKSKAVKIYEVMDGEPAGILKLKLENLSAFTDAIEMFQCQDIAKALDLFNQCKGNNPSDGAADYYVRRCNKLIKEGWDKNNWDGINHMEIK